MNYVVVDFRETETLILTSEIKSEFVYPGDVYSDAPVLNDIVDGGGSGLSRLMQKVRRVSKRGAKYHFILPSNWVRMNCAVSDFDQTLDMDSALDKWKAQILDIEEEEKNNWLFDLPLLIQKYAKLNITSCCVARRYVEVLFEAAMQNGIGVDVVEPSSVAIMRCFDVWNKEYSFVEYSESSVSITAYNPLRGAFTITDDFEPGQNIANKLDIMMPMFDYAVKCTFETVADDDLDIYVVNENGLPAGTFSYYSDRIRLLPSNNRRIYAERINFSKHAALFGAAMGVLMEREVF